MRGYGNFNPSSYAEAIQFIPQYAQSERFTESVIGNFEGGVAYASSVVTGGYYMEGKIPTLLGETFARVLFIPFPESIIGYKPRKMLDIYTSIYDPVFRREGGSYPVIAFLEFLTNFGILGIIIFSLFYILMEKGYYNLLSYWNKNGRIYGKLIKVAFFSMFLQFVRGSGLDSLIIYVIIASVCIIVSVSLLALGKKLRKSPSCATK